MPDYLLLMQDDVQGEIVESDWPVYLAGLQDKGVFRGGSSIGAGGCFRKSGTPLPPSTSLSGFIRITADSLEAAQVCLEGNPVYESGGTVEIRLLPED